MPEVMHGYGITSSTRSSPLLPKLPIMFALATMNMIGHHNPGNPIGHLGFMVKMEVGNVGFPTEVQMPGNSSESTGMRAPATRNLFYSYNMGSVHFVYFSTDTNFLPGSKQYDFLKHDLESVDWKKTPFVVVQGHRPMYTTSHENRDAPIREKMLHYLEPLFLKNNVSLALWGHVHRYERFCPLNNFTCGKMGLQEEYWEEFPVHMVIGMAGQDWQPIWEPRPNHPDVPVFPQLGRSLYRGGEFGYIRLVATKERLTISYVGNHDGEVHDMMMILASGQVLNGGTDDHSDVANAAFKFDVSAPALAKYIKVASVLLLGAFMGYVAGFISQARRDAPAPGGSNWLPVKTQETRNGKLV